MKRQQCHLAESGKCNKCHCTNGLINDNARNGWRGQEAQSVKRNIRDRSYLDNQFDFGHIAVTGAILWIVILGHGWTVCKSATDQMTRLSPLTNDKSSTQLVTLERTLGNMFWCVGCS